MQHSCQLATNARIDHAKLFVKECLVDATHHPVDQALVTRRSVRAFLPKAVPDELLLHLLDLAARAPSGTNTQPWQVHILKGNGLAQFVKQAQACFDDPQAMAAQPEAYDYYPKQWVSPYVDRRRKVGYDLYALLGIAKGDKAAMHRQHARNYCFFDAPVGLFFTIDKVLSQGSWLDYGMFLQSLMIAARGHGLDTCPQAAWLSLQGLVNDFLGLDASTQLVCGMALGYADEAAIENRLVTERVPAHAFARFVSAHNSP
ncbi:MAG: nitroreductase [Betaproteobacteria bacterium]|nr:nitroreductase [Pseudomonadota bacterium]NBO11196.1 nitroreductase [Betaproteobacteria bacterium]NBO43099.1 nitroreductase [Betaproteobacteria bacterium]NBP10348.1 nitroreductase [Betaproteobacteria bacterium]NBP61842.1 nitroreductase [Betaproteobacteria bacterium]